MGNNSTNLSLCPVDPQTKAPGTRGSSYLQGKIPFLFFKSRQSWLVMALFFPSPHCSLFTNSTLWLTRTSQAITLQMSLEIHVPGNPIAPTTDLLKRTLMYSCLPKEVYYTEEAMGHFIPLLVLFFSPLWSQFYNMQLIPVDTRTSLPPFCTRRVLVGNAYKVYNLNIASDTVSLQHTSPCGSKL